MENSGKKVLVTSGKGYLASYIILELLKRNYHVRTTLRSLKKPEKYSHLNNLTSNAKQYLEVVELDLRNEASCVAATSGCDFVFHTVSPSPPKSSKDESEIVQLAVQGTLNILTACLKNKVPKIILTSSIAAVMVGNEDSVCTEDDWSSESACPPYAKSELLAEETAWKFYNQYKDKIEFTSLCPGLCWGPLITQNSFTAGEIVQLMMKGQLPAIPDLSYPIVDVRDAALAHIRAMENKETNGKRYIIVSDCMSAEEIMDCLAKEFGRYGYRFPKVKAGKIFARLAAIFNPMFKLLISAIGSQYEISNKKSIDELGINYRPVNKSLLEMVYSMMEKNVIPDKRKPQPRL